MHLKLILHRTITISGKRSLVILIKLQTTLFNVLAISNVSFASLYKGLKTCQLDMQKHTKIRLIQQFTSDKLCYCSASKVTQNFLSKFISQKFQSLKSLYLICIVNTTDCISSVQTQANFFVILFDQKSLACVLKQQKSLAVVLEHWKSLDCVQEHMKSLAIVLK